MIRDLISVTPEASDTADVCIIGAGAAGILLAVELARRGKKVVILEGGGPEIEEASQEPYVSEIAGLNHNGVHQGRFRAKGGTTTMWGGQILELDEIDFQQRQGIEGSGWPFPKSELTPHYARALELEGVSKATQQDQSVWRQIGMEPPHFTGLELFFSRWCPEPNFARLHRHTLEDHPAVTLWLHANAVEPVCEGQRFRGVRCKTLTGIEAVFHADQFVFCLGGIESSRFFLQSQHSAMPWQKSGLLGKHFQDHIICPAAAIKPIDAHKFHSIMDNIFSRGYKYQPKLRLAPDLQVARGTLNVASMITFISDTDQVLAQLKTTAKKLLRGRWRESTLEETLHAVRHSPLLARQGARYLLQHRAYNPPEALIELTVQCEQEPESKSSITLADSRDSLGMQRTRLDWQISEREIDSIRTYVKVAQQSLAGVAHILPDQDLMTSTLRFIQKCGDNNHHMGGMRMSASPRNGLVDANLRLHGMDNGYICSSAVFPTSGFSNPTHTLLALAVRLAEHLS